MRRARVFPAHPDQMPAIRTWARSVLPSWIPPPTVHDALLVVTELATNSCRHSTSPCVHITLNVRARRLAITVRDFGGHTAATPTPVDDPMAENGRGTSIVRALAHRMQQRSRPAGHTVTAVLPVSRRRPRP